MNSERLRDDIEQALWRMVDAHPWVQSATLPGSFWERPSLETASDIDVVLVVDELTEPRYDALLAAAEEAVGPLLARHGYQLVLNPTLGPLKLNRPRTAVLHLMLYSAEAHVEHAIASPFTCFDWQRTARWRGSSLAEMFPVFALQPQHFVSARRGMGDYLRDFRAREVSFRRLQFTADGYREARCARPMEQRDAHEFAYHVMRFLIENLRKLFHRDNATPGRDRLLADFFAIFPEDREASERLLAELAAKKETGDFAVPVAGLDARLEAFCASVERQFRRIFDVEATRHVAFRHGPTELNEARSGKRIFLGRSDPPLAPVCPDDYRLLAEAVESLSPAAVYSSPLSRCRQSLDALQTHIYLPAATADNRLLEIDYGHCEALTVADARGGHAEFFEQLQSGADPPFPGGENTAAVFARARSFAADRWAASRGNTLTCTHNVVLRCLVGEALALPAAQWHRLQIPHWAPLVFIETRSHGRFVDLPADGMRHLFKDFAWQAPAELACKS